MKYYVRQVIKDRARNMRSIDDTAHFTVPSSAIMSIRIPQITVDYNTPIERDAGKPSTTVKPARYNGASSARTPQFAQALEPAKTARLGGLSVCAGSLQSDLIEKGVIAIYAATVCQLQQA